MAAVRKPKEEPKTDELPENVLVLPVAKVELCAAKGDVRYYLNWPYLDLSDKKKPMLVATNGHILAASEVRVGAKVTEGPIPLLAIKAARSVKTRQPQIGARLIFEGGMVGTGDVMYKRPPGDFKYPDWREVIPTMEAGQKYDLGFNAGYMKLMQEVFSPRQTAKGGVAVFCGRDGKKIAADKPMLLRSNNPDTLDTIGVVMPMHV